MGIQHIEAIKKSKKAILHSIVDINSNAEIVSKKYKSKLFRRIEDLLNLIELLYKKKNNYIKNIQIFY